MDAFAHHLIDQLRLACIFGLVIVLAGLVPIAHASPPAVWIAGIYDEADSDDIVAAVVSTLDAVPVDALRIWSEPVRAEASPRGPSCASVSAGALLLQPVRAPPT